MSVAAKQLWQAFELVAIAEEMLRSRLAVSVTDDEAAEAVVFSLHRLGFRVEALVEQCRILTRRGLFC